MQNEQTINPPPDWAAQEKDLLCPLCGYNLRGLLESRCPECGFKFTWQELLDAEKNKHIYLFEYGKGRNIRTFWKTYWRTCRPRRFWREVNPAQEIRWFRLIVYWILSSSIIAASAIAPYVRPAWQVASQTFPVRIAFKPVPSMPNYFTNGSNKWPYGRASSFGMLVTAAQLDDELPPPWHMKFWREVELLKTQGYYYNVGYFFSASPAEPLAIGWGIIFLGWPLLTLIALIVFRLSMRQAKIRVSHLVRSVVYSCDFGFLIMTIALASPFFCEAPNQGWNIMTFATICAVITTYRLTIAFRQYLRLHLPLATVLASQVIAFLIVFLLLVQISDFSRRI